MILLLAEMAEIKADPQGRLEAVVIESKMDRARGPLATVMVRNGSLGVGEKIRVNQTEAKIRAMLDEKGQKVILATPGKPVEILGFKAIPPVGGKVEKGWLEKNALVAETKKIKGEELKKSSEKKEEKLKLVLKSDASGTLEAILSSLPKNVQIVHFQVGDINESDIQLAESTGAQVIGFRVKATGSVKKLAGLTGVEVNFYQTIYELLEEIEEKVLKLLEPTIDEKVLGQAEIIAEFEIKKERVAGCRVIEGKISKKDRLHLKRGLEIVGDTRIKSMKQGRQTVTHSGIGEEFGAILSPSLDFEVGDMLVSYRPNQQGSNSG